MNFRNWELFSGSPGVNGQRAEISLAVSLDSITSFKLRAFLLTHRYCIKNDSWKQRTVDVNRQLIT